MEWIVLDACVAIKWFAAEVGTEHAVKLLENPDTLFLAPDIFPAEVANGLLRQHREGHLTQALLEAALAELGTVMPQLVSSVDLLEPAVALGRQLGHPVYDCLYLALADRSETVFVTADEKFIDRCRKRLGDDPLVSRLRVLQEYSPS
jgi:predicted nucleic acid-binding protein